jgi:hypothetical protein
MYVYLRNLHLTCENPNHKQHVKNFVKKYPTAKGRVPSTIILVDPNDWSVALEDSARIQLNAARSVASPRT